MRPTLRPRPCSRCAAPLLLALLAAGLAAPAAALRPRPYQQRGRVFVERVARFGFDGAAGRAIQAMLRGGLTIAHDPHRLEHDVTTQQYFTIATDPLGTGSGAVYPELARKVRIPQAGALPQRLRQRARAIYELARAIDAPLYHEIERRFLADTQGARVLMVGRATEGFFYWVNAGLQAAGHPERARDLDQLDMATRAVYPLIEHKGPREAKQLVRDRIYGQLVEVLRGAGYDARQLLREGRRLVICDTGLVGTNPRQLKAALLWDLARSGSARELRQLDQLIELRLLMSHAQGSEWREVPSAKLDAHNFAEVVERRPIAGYVDEKGGRNRQAVFMIDERPHLARPANAFKTDRAGRKVLAHDPGSNSVFDLQTGTPQAAQPDQLVKLDAQLFALALVDLRRRMPADAVLARDHSAGMIRSARVRAHLAARPDDLSLLRTLYREELARARGEAAQTGQMLGPLLRAHRRSEQRFFERVAHDVAAPAPLATTTPPPRPGLLQRLQSLLRR